MLCSDTCPGLNKLLHPHLSSFQLPKPQSSVWLWHKSKWSCSIGLAQAGVHAGAIVGNWVAYYLCSPNYPSLFFCGSSEPASLWGSPYDYSLPVSPNRALRQAHEHLCVRSQGLTPNMWLEPLPLQKTLHPCNLPFPPSPLPGTQGPRIWITP